MNGPDPPRVLDAADVDLNVLGLGGEPFPAYGVPVFTWHRPDRCLVYYRWADDDGERYYTREEFIARMEGRRPS